MYLCTVMAAWDGRRWIHAGSNLQTPPRGPCIAKGRPRLSAPPAAANVIERILRHCGLWEGPLRTLANLRASPRGSPGKAAGESNEPRELELVLDDEFVQAQIHEATAEPPHELQLVLDPAYF
jgi:hypothetical protein